MAKKGRSTKGLRKIRVNTQQNLATLANQAVIKTPLYQAATSNARRQWLMSFEGFISIKDVTAGEGPLIVGVSHSDLSTTEVAEAILAQNSNVDDIIEREQARRPVREWGVFVAKDVDEYLNNDQTKKKYKIKFSVGEGFTPELYIFNDSAATLTTGASVHISGVCWIREY